MAIVVQTRELSRRFGRRWAVARVDLQVTHGERVLILGPNGSGKTTLLRMLATQLAPTQGALELFGSPEIVPDVRRRIGVMGHLVGGYEDLTAGDNLRVFLRLQGRPHGQPEITALLERVRLDDDATLVRRLSAGQRRRLALALLLTQTPELVLLDEPFAQLDPEGLDDIGQVIQGIEGTVIMASHQVERAAALCDRAVLLDRGMVRWSGPAAQAWQAWRELRSQGDARSRSSQMGVG